MSDFHQFACLLDELGCIEFNSRRLPLHDELERVDFASVAWIGSVGLLESVCDVVNDGSAGLLDIHVVCGVAELP